MRRLAVLIAVVTMVMGVMGTASAGGHTADQLDKAGYLCFNAGPSNWTHCIRESKIGKPSIPVKVFSVDGSEFLGTELLLRGDIYSGQGCPQDGLDVWAFPAGPGDAYYACHHFHTGHH